MPRARFVLAVLAAAAAGPAGGARGAEPAPGPAAAILPLSEVKEGMIGVGRTVFRGDRIEDFEVEVLGVLANSTPRRSTILARLRGGPLAEAGVIAGMSGSPVYVDGKLVGAVSSGYAFSKEAIAGITPIEEMLAIGNRDWEGREPARLYRSAGGDDLARRLWEIETGTARELLAAARAGARPGEAGASGSQPIVPVLLSGLAPQVYDLAAGFFRGYDLAPMAAAGVARAPAGEAALVPGAPVAVELIRGDLSIAAFGTVTAREGDQVLAFGHPLFNAGSVNFPLATAGVLTVLPSVYSSSKIAAIGATVGSLEQDRSAAVMGRVGGHAPMVPLQLGIKRGANPIESFSFELASHRLLTPQLLELALLNSMLASEKLVGASTLEVSGRIDVAGEEPVRLDHFFSGDQAGPSAVALVSSVTQALLGNDFKSADIRNMTLTVGYLEDNRFALLDRIWTEKSRVKPGSTLRVKAFLKHLRDGDEAVELTVKVPAGLAAGALDLVVGDAGSLARFEARSQRYQPRTLGQLIDLVNNLRKSNAVYALLSRPDVGVAVKGSKLNALPPSAYALLVGADSSESLLPLRRITLDEASAATPFQVGGLKVARLIVDSGAE